MLEHNTEHLCKVKESSSLNDEVAVALLQGITHFKGPKTKVNGDMTLRV